MKMLSDKLMTRICCCALILAAGLVTGCAKPAQTEATGASTACIEARPQVMRNVYSARRPESEPIIDGNLEERGWRGASWVEMRRGSGLGPSMTQARSALMWDDRHLYFCAQIQDATPFAEHGENDSPVWEDDAFELYIRPGSTDASFFELDFNSQGAHWESYAFVDEGGHKKVMRAWSPSSLQVKTKAVPGGWTIEGRLRLDEFLGAKQCPPGHGDRWTANLIYLDKTSGDGAQEMLAWNPTPWGGDPEGFGVLDFTDWEGFQQDQRDQRLARKCLSKGILENARQLIPLKGDVNISSSKAGVYRAEETGWRPAVGYGRVARLLPEEGNLQCRRMQPNAGDDPTQIDLTMPADGTLVLLGRMPESSVRMIQQGAADGVWITVEVAQKKERLRLADAPWRALSMNVAKGDKARITIDAGPAQNVTSDAAQAAVMLTARGSLESALPGNWKAFGPSRGSDVSGVQEDGKQSIEVCASNLFSGARMEIPVAPGARLYRVTGKVKSALSVTTRAHVGIDYLGTQGQFIRQATTRDALKDFLRWGLYNTAGETAWTPFVAYAYDVPPEAKTLSLWLGVNAWEAPDGEGKAWFSDIRAEPVAWDGRFPLGFAPLTWKPQKPEPALDADAVDGYVVRQTPITAYQLPSMPPAEAKDQLTMRVEAWPDSTASASFSIHAAHGAEDFRVEAMVPGIGVQVRKVCYMYAKRDMMIGEYLLSPNHLEEFESLNVPKGSTQQCWVTLAVGPRTQPGRYRGAIRIIPTRGNAKAMALEVNVLPIAPAARPGVAMGFYSYYLAGDTTKTLAKDFADMRAHGMNTTFMFNHAIRIPIAPDAAGRPVIKWDEPNQLAEFLETYRNAGFSEPAFLLAPQAFVDAARKYGNDPEGKMGPGFTRVYEDLLRQVKERAKAKGWKEFCIAPYDEGYPYPFSDYRFDVTRGSVPALRSLGMPIAIHSLNHPSAGGARFEPEFQYWVDYLFQTFCHPPGCAPAGYRAYATWDQYRDAMHSQGKKVVFYNPDVTGVHPEAMRFAYGIALYKTKADGMMNWHYREPFRDGGYGLMPAQGHAIKNFVFPRTASHLGGPTIGWEAAREGVKDYQLLCTVERLARLACESSDPEIQAKGRLAMREMMMFVNQARLDSINTVGALSLGAWAQEKIDDAQGKTVYGEFKIPNGLTMEDYDRLRGTLCRWVVTLEPSSGASGNGVKPTPRVDVPR